MKYIINLTLILSHAWLVSSFVTPKPSLSPPIVVNTSTSKAGGLQVPGSSQQSRTYDVSMNMDLGIDPAASAAIVSAAIIVFAGQKTNEKNAEDDVETSTEDDVAVAGEIETKEDVGAESTAEAVDEGVSTTDDSGIDNTVKSAMEDMIKEYENDPKPAKKSRPTSLQTPDVDAAKKKVASTLAGEMAMKERLTSSSSDLDIDIKIMEPGPQKAIPKPMAVSSPEGESEEKENSHAAVRILKKVFMPWRKFSNLF
jgi:hypothetical protein